MTIDQPTTPGLTDAQRRIVEWGDGPLVVVAGAGSGKTRVIVERVRWLLESKGDAAPTLDGGLRAAYPAPTPRRRPLRRARCSPSRSSS